MGYEDSFEPIDVVEADHLVSHPAVGLTATEDVSYKRWSGHVCIKQYLILAVIKQQGSGSEKCYFHVDSSFLRPLYSRRVRM
jgi:hypothetical protein